MEFPYGHHGHRRNSDSDSDSDEDERSSRSRYGGGGGIYPPPPPPPFGFDHPPPPPRPFFSQDEFAPPPPPPNLYGHHSNFRPSDSFPPPPQGLTSGYPPFRPPPPHQQEYSDYPPTQQSPAPAYQDEVMTETHQSHRPHLPSFLHHHHTSNQSDSGVAAGGGAAAPDFSNKPTYKVYCKADPNYSLTIRDDKIILALSDPNDPLQHWYKDEKFSTRVKDEEGFPCFSLVNKATGQAMKQSLGATHPVELAAYSWERPDQSVLWSAGKDLGDGYRGIRMVNNVRLNLDAFHGDKKSGGVHDGTILVLWKWNKGDNQLWKITPY